MLFGAVSRPRAGRSRRRSLPAIALPESVTLCGTVTDDLLSLLEEPVCEWTLVSGPGTVTFEDACSPETAGTFSEAGVYVLKLTADDGEYTDESEVTIIVAEAD